MIKRKQFKVSGSNHQYWGILYTPDNVEGKIPIVGYFHGTGETGSTEASTDKLYTNGPLRFIKNGWRPNFMVVALQAASWTPTAESMNYILKNDPDIVSKWNGKALITGLSSGGGAVYGFMNLYNYPEFSYIPMSPAGDGKLKNPDIPYKLWAFAGDSDGLFTNNAKSLASQTEGRLTIYKGGHCCWNTYYDPKYTEVINGESKNIYEWAFEEKITTTTTTSTSTTTTTTKAPRKIKTVTITYSDGSVEVINS